MASQSTTRPLLELGLIRSNIEWQERRSSLLGSGLDRLSVLRLRKVSEAVCPMMTA